LKDLTFKELGAILGGVISAVKDIDFSISKNNFKALIKISPYCFENFKPDPEKRYSKGEVTRVDRRGEKFIAGDEEIDSGDCKYLAQQENLSILIGETPTTHPGFKLFRNIGGRHRWEREEWCLRGAERYHYNPERAEDTGWYTCIQEDAGDNVTPPPGMPQTWARQQNKSVL